MGNELGGQGSLFKNPFSQPGITSETADVLSQFTLKSRYDDAYFGSVCLLEHKATLQLIILKEITYDSMESMEAHFKEFDKRKNKITCDNTVNLKFIIKKSESGFLKDEYKIILFFDYILIDLEKEVENRIKQKKPLSAEEIGNILAGVVNGYAFLEGQGISCTNVRLSNIYFGFKDSLPIVKVGDPNLFPTTPNFEMVNRRESGYQQIFLSPEEMNALVKKTPVVSNDKSGVYSLGACFLELFLLQYSCQVYKYKEPSMNIREIEDRVNVVKNKYPLGIYYVLKEMLEKSPEHRLSFSGLQQRLPTNIKKYSTETLTLTVGNKGGNPAVKNNVVPLATKQKTQMNSGPHHLHEVTSKSIAPSMVPSDLRQVTSLTAQYRPQPSTALAQVNQHYTNGNSYQGQKNALNQRHGKGKYMYSDGSYYYGDWVKNKMFGSGILYYDDGQVEYDGDWKDDVFHGRGTLYGKGCDWNKYQGEFANAQMNGFGTMWFNDGNVWTGGFKADKPIGKGRMSTNSGQTITGCWEGANFVKD